MYNDITAPDNAYGNNMGGICSFQFVPKEWVTSDIKLDKVTGTVNAAPVLAAGRAWLVAGVMDQTAEFTEKEKQEKAGKYYEATLTGVINKDEVTRHVSLATLRFHELIVIYTDQNKVRRIIGNRLIGMNFAVDFSSGKALRDASTFSISLAYQSVEPSPIYTGP